MGERLLQAAAVIDVDVKGSEKIVLLGKKIEAITRMTKMVGQTRGFEGFDRVARGLERSSTAAQGLDRALAAIRNIDKAERLARSFDRASNAMRRTRGEAERLARMPALAVGAGYAAERLAHGTAHSVGRVVETYRDFDDKRRYQKAILGLTDEQQQPFVDQALRMGAHTPFNDIQVLEAQLDLAQRGVDKEFIRPIVEMAADYAQAMGSRLPEAAKTIEGILFSTGKHMGDMGSALKEAQRAVDFSVKLAKIGGLDNEDIKQFFKYGGQPGSVAGFSDPVLGAMAAMMRRSNIRGDESGVAVRSFAANLVSPTKKGIGALQAMGIDYNSFVRTPGALSPDNLDMMTATTFGRHLTARQKTQLGAIMADPDKIASREDFVADVTKIVGSTFDKNKKGELKATDAAKIAKMAGTFWQNSLASVDTEGLLRAIIASNPSLAQANAVFGSRQGGRFMSIGGKLEMFDDYVKRLQEVGPGFASHIAEERMAGFSGALTRAEGAVKNFETAIGRANDAWATQAIDLFSSILNHASKFDQATLLASTAMTGLASLAGSVAALSRFIPGLPHVPLAGAAGAVGGAYLGYELVDRVLNPFADVVGGKYWKPSDRFGVGQLQAELMKAEADRAKLVARSRDPESLGMVVRPYDDRIARLRERIAESGGAVSPSTAFLAAEAGDLDPSVRGAQDLARLTPNRPDLAGPSIRGLAEMGLPDLTSVGTSLEAFPAALESALAAGLSGSATVAIEVKPGAMFDGWVRGIVKSEMGKINVTGPGSVGRTGGDIEGH